MKPSAKPAVELRDLTLRLGEERILSGLNLSVGTGEFVSLLGPSGVGKSTILNAIAGFLPVESGEILLHGRDMTRVPAHRRNLGFIFQEYALFPHMTVEENVRFPLDMRRVKRRTAEQQVAEALQVVGLPKAAKRRPHALSGGQRQRVAIARAMVFRPEVLLMDEPLSSLDRQLRDEMTLETRRLQRELGVTVIYVTHDQTEALSLSDRVGIVREGGIEQIAPPAEVHDRPISIYAARLCGPLNVQSVSDIQFNGRGDSCRIALAGSTIVSPRPQDEPDSPALGVRPYLLTIQQTRPEPELNAVPGKVVNVSMVGNGLRYDVEIGLNEPWQVLVPQAVPGIEVGLDVFVAWSPKNSLLLDQ